MITTPTTQELSDTIVGQLEGAIEQTLPLLPKAFNRVIAKVLAGVFILLYKYVGFSLLQQFVQHASWRETIVNGKTIRPLVEWGRMLGVGDPFEATQAELTVEMNVLTIGGTLAASQQIVRPDTKVIYLSLAPVTIDAATETVLIRAYSDPSGNGGAGIIGNLQIGDKLEFARSLGNIAQEVTVTAINVVGAAAETEAAYRARVLRRKQRPPQGGAYADYRVWGEEAAGVANIYPYAGNPGEVDIYVECTPNLEPDGIADLTLRNAVYAATQLDAGGKASRRPISDAVNVLPIVRRSFALVITGLIADDMAAAQAALTTGVDEHLRTLEPFILGLSVQPRRDRVSQGAIAGVVHEIVAAAGGVVSKVELYLDAQLITAYTLDEGERAKLLTPSGITYA